MVILVYFLVRMLFATSPAIIKEKAFIHTAMAYSEWVCVKDSKGIALLERWVKVNDSLNVRERRGEMIVNCNYQDAINYLKDPQTVNDWMKGIKSVRQINSGEQKLVYMVIQLPWPFSNRDLVGQYSVLKFDDKHCVIKVESQKSTDLSKTKLVRIEDYRASWKLQRISENRTKVVFTTFSSEPPMFPQWVQEPVLKKVFYGNLKRMREELSEQSRAKPRGIN